MSNTRRADPYYKLLRIVISLLVLFAVCLVAYFLIDSSLQGKYRKEQERIVEQNNAMVQEYNEAVLAQRSQQTQPDAAPSWPQPSAEGMDVVSLKGFAVKGVDQVSVTRSEALQGGLMLLNRWHSLPDDFTLAQGDLKSIMDETQRRVPTARQQLSLFPAAISALDQMIAAAKAEGLEDYLVRDAYRSIDTQAGFWNTKQEEIASKGKLTGDMLTEEVRKTVAYPGTSDYHSGMSVDMDVWNQNDPVLKAAKIHDTVQGQWLVENSWKYGYVFRYPVTAYPTANTVDKSFKTAINLQMNTYRYVGVPHAAVMHQLDLCLEEYIEYLMENQHVAVYEDGQLAHEIFRVAVEPGDHDLRLPANASSYIVSDDNMGGLVVAVTF